MKQLNIYELQSSINRKQEHRNLIYESVLKKCHIKIKSAADKELYEINFDVPQYVVGLPLYNINNCLNFIIEQLQSNGFKVIYHFPKLLQISWFPSNKNNEQSNNYGQNNEQNNDQSRLFLNYIPYKNDKGKFVLNID